MHDFGLVEGVATVFVLCLIGWQFVFFQVVRPKIMSRVGRWLAADVRESTGAWDAGLYDTEGPSTPGKTTAVAVADFLVTVLGTVGVFAAFGIPAFLLAEAGLPNRWEGIVTGTSIRIADADVPAMVEREVNARITLRNDSRIAMAQCVVQVEGYRAQNGYLRGRSRAVRVEPGATLEVPMTLGVQSRVSGTHSFRMGLECANRLKDRMRTRIIVR